ncbi:MAG TPA: hypothetical protein VFQ80_06840, partial [Thermomicrobiales bacterium]|nr:hypothetical protein [Thermomicrobiales bacterium]
PARPSSPSSKARSICSTRRGSQRASALPASAGGCRPPPDGFVRLPTGASVSARDGHLGMTRNSSAAPASLLVVMLALDANAAGMAEGSSAQAVPGDAHRPHRRRRRDGDTPYATISPGSDGGPPWTDLTETGPLPAIPAGASAGLRRITLAPGEALDIGYVGPTLYYVEQGTLGVDPEHHRLAFVGSDSTGGKHSIDIGRHGEVPAGIGVYTADGNLGPTRNAGDEDLVILALLIVPPSDAIERVSGEATMAATPAAADRPPREKREGQRGAPEPQD